MSYKLIALDLDMTLLNKEKKISDVNKEAVKMAKEKGVHVILCSGRILNGVLHYANVLGIDNAPVIACNGAIVHDLRIKKDVFYMGINNESCIKIADICNKNDVYYHFYYKNTIVAKRLEYSSKFYIQKNKELPPEERINVEIDNSYDKIYQCDNLITKFVIVDSDIKKVDYIRSLIEDQVEDIEVAKSDINILDITKKGINKKIGLEFVCNYLDVKKEEVIAIGDNENDIEMIKYASVGIAMGNAIDEVKSVCDYMTDTFENDGVAKAIYKFILEEKLNVYDF